MKNLLIIEDDAVVARVYRTSVEKHGFAAEVCTDGQSGLQRAQEHKPDAILLDIMLPKINGLELLKRLRNENGFASLPIIVLTNAYIPNVVQEAFNAGASQVFNKANVTPRHILDALEQLLNGGKVVVNAAPVVTALPTPQIIYEHPGSPPPPSNYGYNENYRGGAAPPPYEAPKAAQASAARTRGSCSARELEAHRAFIAANTEAVSAMRKLVQGVIGAAHDPGVRDPLLLEFYRKVHALIGSAGMAGVSDLAQLASVLEVLLKELMDQPKTINDSTLRTVNGSVEFIIELFRLSQPGTSDLPPARILIVDDDPLSRRAILFALKKTHLEFESADIENPSIALNLAQQRAFDLIFLDVQMPGLDGFELCTKIRSLPLNKTTPIIFVTSLSDFKNRAKSTMRGGSDLIAKPFLFVELGLKALTVLLRNRVCPRREAA
jgi:CheY-like chemotaxis protein/HPt (histidine-containing phosphotransfer) domain-containing protein